MGTWRFVPLTDEHLPLLHEWMNEPGVVKFWEGDDVSWPGIVAQYGQPQLRSALATDYPDFDYDAEEADFDWEHVEGYIAELDGEPAGWIQCYAIKPYDYHSEVKAWIKLGFDENGAGIDYLIGSPGERGKGVGSSMISAFIDDIVFGQHEKWTEVGASPQRANGASCGALARAGLGLVGSFDDEIGPCDLYSIGRKHRGATSG